MIKLLDMINTPSYTIYCDLDSVLVDFDRGFKNLTNYLPKDYENEYGLDKFWDAINEKGVKFWASLKWMSDGRELWDYIKKYNPTLLSAPSREESSKIGKRIWVKNNLPNTKLILSPAQYKKRYAGENKILIDDREQNIYDWISSGGIGILHTSTNDTIKQLQKYGL